MAIEFLQDIKILGSDGSTTTIEGSGQSTLNLKTTTNSKSNYIVGTTTGSLSLRPNGTETLTLNSQQYSTFASRVGIGVAASTNAMLDVKGPDTNNAVLGRFWSNTGARGSFIIRNGTGVDPTTFIGTAGGSEELSIGTNNTEAIRIDATIGTPKSTFVGDVAIQKNSDVYLTLESTATSTTEEVAVKYNNQSTGSNYWWSGLNQSANYSLAYGTSYSGSNVKMEISTTGNATFTGDVIATDGSDTATLSKSGLTLSRGNSYIQSDADNSDTLNIGQSSVRWGHVKVDGADFAVLNGGNERFKINSSGNATFAGTITTSDNSNDNYIGATFTDSSFTRIHGYGLYMSRSHSYIRPTSDNNKQLYLGSSSERWSNIEINTPTATFSGNISANTGSFSGKVSGGGIHYRSIYNTGTTGFLIETDISSSEYSMFQGRIVLEQFNFNSKQVIEFSATGTSSGAVHTSKGTADIDVTIKLFVYNSKWYLWIPSPSTYTTCTAKVMKSNAYQGSSHAENAIVGISAAAVPGSGVTGSTDIVCKFSQGDATFAGNIALGDGKLLKFGASDDYQIYHNSTTNVNHIFSNLDRQLSINAGIIQLTNQANNTTYLKLESTGATFAGDVLASKMLFTTLNGHAHLDSQSSSLMIEASNIQAMGNLIPDGNGNRPLGATNRYWSHLYANGITTKAINITQTADVGELTTANLDSGAAVGLSLTYPTSNVAAGDGLAMSIGIAGRGRSYIANSNTSNNLDASNLEFYTEGGGVINKVLTLGTEKEATFTGEIYTPDGSASAPSYSFSGRTDTGMYARAHSTNDRISFTTDGSERFYIDANGTTSVGNSYVGEDNSFRNYAGDWAGTTGTANKGFYFLNTASGNSTKAMELTHDGNATFAGKIGIGTAPSAPLHIAGTSGSVAGSAILFNGSTAIWQPSDATLTIRPSGTDAATFSSTSTTFSGDVTATANYTAGNSKIIYKAQRSGGAVSGDWSYDDATTDMSLGTSTAHSFSLKTGDTRALTLDSSQNATFAGSVQAKRILIQSDDNNRFVINSNDHTISRIIARGSTGENLDKGLFSLMSTVSGESTIEKVRIDSGGNSWFNGGAVSFGDNVTVTGNLIVEGTTTTLNTETVEVEDNIIVLNKTQSDNSATAATSGISIYRGLDASDNAITEASLIFDDADDTWDLTNNLKVGGDVTLYQNNINLDRNGATIFDNTSNNNAWYIRNGGSNSATLQFGLGDNPGQNIKHTFNGDGSVEFGGDVILPASKALYLDGGGGTYIYQSSDGVIDFYGDTVQLLTLKQNGTQNEVVVNEGSGDIDFRVEANTNANAFFVEAEGSGAVAIGHNDPQEVLHVKKTGTARIEIEGTDGPTAFKATNDSGSYGWYIPGADNSYRLWNFGTSADLVTVLPTGETHIGGVSDGPFTALRLMNQKTYGSGTGVNEKVRFAMGIAENGIAYSGREGFVIDVGVKDESDSSNAVINFQARDGGTIGTYQTVNGHDKSVEFVGATTFKHGGTTNKTVFGSGNEINTFTAAGGSATMYLNWQSGNTNIGKSALVVENQGDSTFKGSIHPHADSTYNIGTDATRFAKIYADNFYGDGSNLTNVAAAAHNHNDIYYTETEIDANHYGKTATDAKFTSTDGSGDNYTFEIEDASHFTGNKWYHIATLNSHNGGLHIRGAILNHVENFAAQKLDIAIQVREGGSGANVEIAGSVDVFHNDDATNGTDKAGIRVIQTSTANTNYQDYKVYVRICRYSQLTLRLTQQGSVTFNTDHSSPLTTEPAPVSGGSMELDTSTLQEGAYIIKDSSVKTILYDNYDDPTFTGRVDSQVFSIDGASVASYQDFQSKPIDTDSGMFTVGGHGEQAGYSRAVSLWTSHDGSWNSWVGTNLRWDGTNFKRASDNGSQNWGNISGIRFLGNSSTTGSGMDFLIDPPTQTDAPSGEQTIGTSIPSSMIALSLRNDLSADFKGDVKLSTGKSIYLSGTSGLRLTHDGSNAHMINAGTGDLNFKNDASDKDIFFTGTDGTTAVTALTLDMSEGGNAIFGGDITQSDGKRIWFRGSNADSGVGAQSYIHSDGLNLKIKGDDNVRILGDGGGTIAHFDYTGKVGIGIESSLSSLLHIKGSGDAIRVESTNTGGGGAQIDLLHFTTSPADEDIHAVINMGGYYTGTTSVYGSQIKSIWTDVSDRHSRLEFTTCDTTINTVLTLAHDKSATFEGDVNIAGDLNITGDINSVSVTDLDVTDKTITIAKGAADSAAADGAGIVVDGAGASLLYDHTGTQWEVNKPFEVKVGSSAITMTEYSDGAVIWLDGSDGDFAGSDYYNIAAYGGGQGSKLSFGYGAAEKMYMDRAGSLLTHGTIDVQGTGQSQIAGNLYIKGGGYNQIKIANNLTADTNKQSGIVTENYEGNNVSILQTFQQNNSNAIYYGSADASFAGIQSHYFYVNADSDTAGSGHEKAFEIKSDKNSNFYGNVKVKGTNVTVENVTNPYIYLNDTDAGAALFQQEGNDTRIGSDSNTTVKIIQNNQDAVVIDTSKNATFAGAVSTGGYLTLNSSDDIPRLIFNGSGDDFFFSNTANYFGLYNDTDSRWDIKVDGAGDTTFAGSITASQFNASETGDYITFYGNDDANHSISSRDLTGAAADDLRFNSYGSMIFNLDSNNNNGTNADFVIGRHGGDGQISSASNGVLFFLSGETGDATFAGDITLDDDLNFSTNGFADISNTGTGAMRFKPSSQTLALTLTGANATFEGLAKIKGGLTTDGYAKFYNWRALQNTTTSSNLYYRIARITATQSTRFIIELAGRSSSYGDENLPAYGKLVGQLNNDDNYDLFYYDHSNVSAQVVTEIGQVDVSATETDIYIKVGQFAEITAIGHISDGSITTYDSDSGSSSAPTNYDDAKAGTVWNAYNDGSGSGLDADKLDNLHASSFLRSDANDTASGSYTFTGEATFALDSSFANSQVKIAATTDQNPKIMFYRPTGSGTNSYPWRLQAGGGGSSSGFYIGTGASAQNTQETIANKLGLSSSGTLTVKGDVVAYGSPSDKNYKENIKPIENALDKVMDLEGVSFDWKESDSLLDIKEDIGFIAQDVQKVVPELVRENEDGNLSLRYQGLIPVLLEAMKEQQKQIDELKSQMAVCNKRACNCKK